MRSIIDASLWGLFFVYPAATPANPSNNTLKCGSSRHEWQGEYSQLNAAKVSLLKSW
jgi:hypothetical protein